MNLSKDLLFKSTLFLVFIGIIQMANAQSWTEFTKLDASDAHWNDRFGEAVCISGNIAVVGAKSGSDDADVVTGSAYIYELVDGVWEEVVELTPSDGGSGDFFGRSVSISGMTVIVGATEHDAADWNAGAVYVYERIAGVWTEVTKLTASDAAINDRFGEAVGISGDRVIVGARLDDDAGENSGSAYIFELIGGIWTEVAKLTASDAESGDYFGHAVSISDTVAIVSCILDDEVASLGGSVYIYERLDGVWTETATITASDGEMNDRFGNALFMSEEEQIIVGCKTSSDAGERSGSAYIFERSGGTWVEVTKLTASDAAEEDRFGNSVSISGTVAIVGAHWNDDDGEKSGSVYIFELIGGIWTEVEILHASDPDETDYFGHSVSVSGNTAIVGAPYNHLMEIRPGSAYIFNKCNPGDVEDVLATVDNSEICLGQSVTFSSSGADEYTWDVAGVEDGEPYTPETTGTMTFIVTGTDAETRCQDTGFVEITVYDSLNVEATVSTDEVCLGDVVTFTGAGADTYVWDGGVVDGIPFSPLETGTFTFGVTGTSDEGCYSTASIDIRVMDCQDTITSLVLDENICVGECASFSVESTGSVESYRWDFGGAAHPDTSLLKSPVACFDSIGVFEVQVTVTNETGQVTTETREVTVHALPDLNVKMDTIIEMGDAVDLIAISDAPGIYQWSPEYEVACDSCAITTARPQENTQYSVSFLDENGCEVEDTLTVLVNVSESIGVPTAFSPNSDGNNDRLYVKGARIESMTFSVYNRYGELVFESSEQSFGWNGTFKNQMQNPGVFTWVLQYGLISGKSGVLKGNTTLIL